MKLSHQRQTSATNYRRPGGNDKRGAGRGTGNSLGRPRGPGSDARQSLGASPTVANQTPLTSSSDMSSAGRELAVFVRMKDLIFATGSGTNTAPARQVDHDRHRSDACRPVTRADRRKDSPVRVSPAGVMQTGIAAYISGRSAQPALGGGPAPNRRRPRCARREDRAGRRPLRRGAVNGRRWHAGGQAGSGPVRSVRRQPDAPQQGPAGISGAVLNRRGCRAWSCSTRSFTPTARSAT